MKKIQSILFNISSWMLNTRRYRVSGKLFHLILVGGVVKLNKKVWW